MCNKYFDGNIPDYVGLENEQDVELEEFQKSIIERFENKINEYEFASSLQTIWELISKVNKYIDETKPWELAKIGTAKISNLSFMCNIKTDSYIN